MEMKKENKDDRAIKKTMTSPLDVKLINCAEIEFQHRSPILCKTEEKKTALD
jgi:hypothetical protein